MILFYRITSFLVALASAFGFAAFLLHGMHPVLAVLISLTLVALLFSRLLQFKIRSFSFWFFLGTALVFLLSSFAVLFLFESFTAGVIVACIAIGLLTLFCEFVFLYVHLPGVYQPFSLEYLTWLLNLLSVFFLTVSGFAVHLLIQFPLYFLLIPFFPISYFLIYGMLWVSKAESITSRRYAFFGALIFSELFIAISFLPTGFYTNAAFLAIFAYVFFGLARAQVIHKLSVNITRRYIITACLLLLFIGVSSQWL